PLLKAAPIQIVDTLPDGALARTVGGTILINGSAAGWGWSTDVNAAPAANRMDLLTVVAHEFGHILGYESGDLALPSLDPGVRRTPTALTSLASLASMMPAATVQAPVASDASSQSSQPAADSLQVRGSIASAPAKAAMRP